MPISDSVSVSATLSEFAIFRRLATEVCYGILFLNAIGKSHGSFAFATLLHCCPKDDAVDASQERYGGVECYIHGTFPPRGSYVVVVLHELQYSNHFRE